MSSSTAPDEQGSEQQAQLIMYPSTHPVVYRSSHPYFYPQHPQPSEGFPTHGVTMYQAASSSPFLFQAQGYPIYTPHSNHFYQQFTIPSRCIPALEASHSSDSQATTQQLAITTSHSTKSTTPHHHHHHHQKSHLRHNRNQSQSVAPRNDKPSPTTLSKNANENETAKSDENKNAV
ncbi:hypothetical protein BCR33DRAFT_734169 [Rhizoclosmatium globosum]|uniref:Uncharacterized protein n=1 Tax=Rhizoclosmatium globosum TaxID=329046 RepID=A0A1Y2CVN4_9FUNG|nr:hypothetical protein BCR33DRAFT_734169 [Rhizoclosmatium globosum]|eukprot:ORY51037.1 hypothetical protein BCR33DRAFT_734169 [Rhizoclosmatium globosum]